MKPSLFGFFNKKNCPTISEIGLLYYSGLNQSTNWFSTSNWYCNSGLTISSNNQLPSSSTNTFICGRCSPNINVDSNWISPKSITVTGSQDASGIYLYSYKNNTFTGCIIGNSVFSGNIEVANSIQQSIAVGPCSYTNPITNQLVCSVNINGPTTFGYFRNGIIYNNYTNYTPQLSINGTSKYVIFNNGKATLASGAFANGYYSGGLFIDHFSTTDALDSPDGKTYTVKSGQSIAVNGFYGSAYYDNGVRIPKVPNGNGEAIYPSSDGRTYVNNNGQIELAHGPYSFGYFFYGYRIWTTIPTPVQVLDSNIYHYWYSSGMPIIANGYFTVGYFEEGIRRNMSHPTPLIPQDSVDNYYCYETITCYGIADGFYSNGYFTGGFRTAVDYFTTTVALDCEYLECNKKWFDYYTNSNVYIAGPTDRAPLLIDIFSLGQITHNGDFYLYAKESNGNQKSVYIICGCEISPIPDYVVHATDDQILVGHSTHQNGYCTFVGADPNYSNYDAEYACWDGGFCAPLFYSAGEPFNGTINSTIGYTWMINNPEGPGCEVTACQAACVNFLDGVASAYIAGEIP